MEKVSGGRDVFQKSFDFPAQLGRYLGGFAGACIPNLNSQEPIGWLFQVHQQGKTRRSAWLPGKRRDTARRA